MNSSTKPKIMIVDDNVTNLNISRKTLCDGYSVILIKSGEMAIAEIPNTNPDLILLDVEMPGLSGFDVINKIKNEMPERFKSIPIIFLTAKDDSESEFQGLNLGAVDYVRKPFSAALLKKRVEVHLKLHNYSTNLENMVKEKTADIEELQYAIVYAMSAMVDKRDNTTGGHILRTSKYLRALLNKLIADGSYKEELENVDVDIFAHASQMHDVGKICIADRVLLKEGKLSNDEYEEMKQHTLFGKDIIRTAINNVQNVKFLETAEMFATSHHEKWNGKGYPFGLKGEEIPIGGRIMAIVDAYDAIRSERPYKQAKTHLQAVDIILKDSAEHFDPVMVDAFVQISNEFETISAIEDDL